ncbi:MAG: hypothetical protein AMXMBFR6_20570 [Betaproteobacteria bacterium]
MAGVGQQRGRVGDEAKGEFDDDEEHIQAYRQRKCATAAGPINRWEMAMVHVSMVVCIAMTMRVAAGKEMRHGRAVAAGWTGRAVSPRPRGLQMADIPPSTDSTAPVT